MKRYIIGTLVTLGMLTIGCNRKIAPTIIYEDKIVSRIDTVLHFSDDTVKIPCDDFDYQFFDQTTHDTIYVTVEKQVLKVKTIVRRDTVYRETIIVQPAPLRSVTKIDNSVRVKAKNGSAVGDGNTITTKKTNWWWIFLAGMLTWFIIQNVGWRFLKKYIPVLNFTS